MPFTLVPGRTFEGYPSVVSHTVRVSDTETREVVTVFARLGPDGAGRRGLGMRALTTTAAGAVLWYGDDWRDLGGDFLSDPVAMQPVPRTAVTLVSPAEPPYRVFLRGLDNALWVAWSDGSAWTGPSYVGGEFTSEISVVDSPRGVHVFLRGLDNALWAFYGPPDGSVTHMDAAQLGGLFDGNPKAVADREGQINIFVRGRDGHLWRKWSDENGWHGFAQLSGSVNDARLAGDPAPVTVEKTGLRGYVVYPAGSIVYTLEEGGGGAGYCRVAFDGRYEWSNSGVGGLSGTLSDTPAGANRGPGTTDVFARTTVGKLLHGSKSVTGIFPEPAFPHWLDTGDDPFAGRPSVASAGGRLHVFVRGVDGRLYHQML